MTNEIKLVDVLTVGGVTKEQMERNNRVLEKVSKESLFQGAHGYENPSLVEMLESVHTAKAKYMQAVEPYAVTILDAEYYPTEEDLKTMSRADATAYKRARAVVSTSQYGTKFIGRVVVQLPAEFAQIKVWNKNVPNSKGKMGAMEWLPFEHFNLDLVKGKHNVFKMPAAGSGILVMPIKEGKDGLPMVNLPVDKNGDFWSPVFRTADSRFVKSKDAAYADEPLFLSDNNAQFNAMLTAKLQLLSGEFVQANPENIHAVEKRHCGNAVRLGTKDGLDDDLNTSRKSRVVLQQPDVMQLAQVGPYQPQTVCMVKGIFLDEEWAVLANKETQKESTDYTDEEGRIRYQNKDEILVGTESIHVQELRQQMIEEQCAQCPFFCNNSPKSEARVAKEKTDARLAGKNDYVSAFYKERPKAERQAIQTLVEFEGRQEWVMGAPGEHMGKVDAILDVRVKGAGLAIYAAPEVLADLDVSFVPAMEAYDARTADVMKKINYLFYAAFNLRKLTEEQLVSVFTLAENKPADMTAREEEKWENALYWLAQGILWQEEDKAREDIALFPQKFFAGVVDNRHEIHVEQVMAAAMDKEAAGTFGYGLGYEDLAPSEFVRQLDDAASDYVNDVIMSGMEFAVVGGTDKEKELAAGALQQMLQNELTRNYETTAEGKSYDMSLLAGLRREENPLVSVVNMNVCDEVKNYLIVAGNLLN